MKLNLFLLVLSIFAVLHLCKAGPLRLHKRAAFYIANETACVVDNIVYSNGDPIPTDDPCEACKCRPPGFACVLKECKMKPGCKAVRRVGQCCPDYICGCEHNGRMYLDGEEIRDPKNPCYECHCQGSSIACAFVDCFFRDDCDTVYVPGECCPEYRNCTRDVPENNPFVGSNALPSVNLLPALNDESVLLGDFPSAAQTLKSSEKPADTTQHPTPSDNHEETFAPEVKDSTDVSGESETTESADLVTEDVKLDPQVEDVRTSSENKEDLLKDETHEKAVEVNEEEKASLFNSETGIKKDDSVDSTTVQIDSSQPTVEETKEEKPQTEFVSEIVEENDAEVTEKPLKAELTSTEIPESEKKVKNSAAENGKSLKISDDKSKDSEKEKKIQTDELENTEEKLDETVTESETESSSKAQSEVSEESSSTENKLTLEENAAEGSQINPQDISFYSNDDKIKSESAETVTIVVHVREKTKPSTEKDFVTENFTPESVTRVTEGNLFKSNELSNTEVSKETTKLEESASTGKNFEVFPSSTEISKDETTTNVPSTDKSPEDKIEGRSDETNSTALNENPTSEENISDFKKKENSVTSTTENINDITEISKEARGNEEVVEEAKADVPIITVIRIDPNAPIEIKITTDSATASKIEEQTKESENTEKTVEEIKSEEKVEENPEITDESIVEEKVEENPEIREDESEPEEKTEQAASAEKVEQTTPAEKIEFTSETKPEERTQELKLEETTQKINTEISETGTNKPEGTTEGNDQGNEESKQTEAPSDNE